MKFAALVVLVLSLPSVAAAQNGGVIVRVPDGISSTCIASNQRVYVTLRRLITTRRTGWFVRDKSVALVINATVHSNDGQADKRINFPLASKVDVQDYSAGQVSLPIEYSIVSGLPLTQEKNTHRGIQLEMTLINLEARTGLGKGLEALVEVTKNLPIPSTPLISAGSYLLDYANKAVDKEVQAHNDQDKAKSATVALQFDPTGRCAGDRDWEQTGTVAVLQAEGPAGAGHIDINGTNGYCWAADLKPVFVLKAARKDPVLSCNAAGYKPVFFQVTNNYTAFFVNAAPIARTLGDADQEEKDAIARCTAHGIKAASCIPRP